MDDKKNGLEQPCPIARTVGIVGDAWSWLILRDALTGISRFDQFRKSLGIAPTILTRRLALLVDEGLLEKRLYSQRPPREDYVLTDAGRDLLPVLFMIGAWGKRHRGGGKLTTFVDAETGVEIRPIAVDEASGAPIGSRPMRAAGVPVAGAPTEGDGDTGKA